MAEANENTPTPEDQATPTPTPEGGEAKPEQAATGLDVKALLKTPEFQAEIKGLMDNKNEILQEKRDLEKKVKGMESMMSDLGGTEGIKSLKRFQEQLQQDEDSKLFAEGNRDEYNRRITERARQEKQGEIDNLAKQNENLNATIETQQKMLDELVIDAQVDAVISSLDDIVVSAIPKVKRDVRDKFKINRETGRPEAKDSAGQLEYGADGKPLNIKEWMTTTMKEESPFYFRGHSGGGASGSQTAPNGQPRITRDQARDFQYYKKMREKAMNEGGPDAWPPKEGFQ